jgi:hypothetical protein
MTAGSLTPYVIPSGICPVTVASTSIRVIIPTFSANESINNFPQPRPTEGKNALKNMKILKLCLFSGHVGGNFIRYQLH